MIDPKGVMYIYYYDGMTPITLRDFSCFLHIITNGGVDVKACI